MKLNYTISCINKTQSLDEVESIARLCLYNQPEEIIQKHLWEQTERIIELMKNGIILLIKNELSLINGQKEKNNIGYASMVNSPYDSECYHIHEIYIEPKRRNQWGWTAIIEYILENFWHEKEITIDILRQEKYNNYFVDYDTVYKRNTPSIDRKKLIWFLKNKWFAIDDSPFEERYWKWFIVWTYSPTTTPPIDANTWPSYDQ